VTLGKTRGTGTSRVHSEPVPLVLPRVRTKKALVDGCFALLKIGLWDKIFGSEREFVGDKVVLDRLRPGRSKEYGR
jgi:hypothetical protein